MTFFSLHFTFGKNCVYNSRLFGKGGLGVHGVLQNYLRDPRVSASFETQVECLVFCRAKSGFDRFSARRM